MSAALLVGCRGDAAGAYSVWQLTTLNRRESLRQHPERMGKIGEWSFDPPPKGEGKTQSQEDGFN